jgi:phosphoribosyl-ATP pyrophosphohydrolase
MINLEGWGRAVIGRVKTFDELYAELKGKVEQGDPGSATVAAVKRGVHGVGKKVVEEAAESWMAAEHEGPERAAEEISQLLYQAQVLMLAAGVELKDVYKHL